MGGNGFIVVDGDSHVFEPAEIWERYLEPEYRVAARSAFYFNQDHDGLCTVILNGRAAPAINSVDAIAGRGPADRASASFRSSATG